MALIKTAMYRRGRGCANDGLKERALWLLSKGPATESELCKALKVSKKVLAHNMHASLNDSELVASVSVSEWFTAPDGNPDRIYTLNRKVRRIAPRVEYCKAVIASTKSLQHSGEDKKRAAEQAAARRRRLIAAGLYITSSDLC